jgi:hypothetical protein
MKGLVLAPIFRREKIRQHMQKNKEHDMRNTFACFLSLDNVRPISNINLR